MPDNDNITVEPTAVPAVEAYMQAYVPPLSERIWTWLGFGYCSLPLPEIEDGQGTLTITSEVRWSWSDRLRILLSGRTFHYTSSVADMPVKRAASTLVVSVLPPTLKALPR